MKKVLAFLSAFAFASASQSEGFLTDHELSIKPLPPNPIGTPFMFYADNEQYSRHYVEQNLHHPLITLFRKSPEKPLTPVAVVSGRNQQRDESKFVENSLYELRQMMKHGGKVRNHDKVQKPKLHPDNLDAHNASPMFGWKDPSRIRREHQKG